MSPDSVSSIFHSAKRFFSGTMLSRLTGLLRDILMASAFGTQESAAAFLVAFRFAHLFRRILGEGALQTAFIPQFEKLRQVNSLRAALFFRDLTLLLTLFLTLLITLTIFVLPKIIKLEEWSTGNQEIIHLTLLMLPSLLFICLYGLNASLLQCEKYYFVTSVAPVAFNLAWILGILCLSQIIPLVAMQVLAYFVILGCAFQWLVTLPSCLKVLHNHGLTFFKILSLKREYFFFSTDLKGLFKPLVWGIIGVSASQISNAFDAIFARYAELEGPAYLWYAIRLQQLPLGLFGIALSGALLPPLARAFKQDLTDYKQFIEFTLSRALYLMIPITFGIFILGDQTLYLLYGRGEFKLEALIGTTYCLWAYGAGLIPMTLLLILSAAFYAQQNFRLPMLISLTAVAFDLIINTLLVLVFHQGSSSIAWATSASAWLNYFLLAFFLTRAVGHVVTFLFWKDMGIIMLASFLGTVLSVATGRFLMGFCPFWSILWSLPSLAYPTDFTLTIFYFSCQSLAFLLGFALLAYPYYLNYRKTNRKVN